MSHPWRQWARDKQEKKLQGQKTQAVSAVWSFKKWLSYDLIFSFPRLCWIWKKRLQKQVRMWHKKKQINTPQFVVVAAHLLSVLWLFPHNVLCSSQLWNMSSTLIRHELESHQAAGLLWALPTWGRWALWVSSCILPTPTTHTKMGHIQFLVTY